MPFARFYRMLVIVLAILALTAGCSAPVTPAPPATETAPAVSVTPSTTPAATASPQPQPTITPRAVPSSTPTGFFALYSAGFAVTLPSTWVIHEKSGRHITAGDPGSRVILVIESKAEEDNTGVEALLETIMSDAEDGVTFTGYQKSTVSLADELQAERLEMIMHGDEVEQDLWLISAQRGKRNLSILVAAPRDTLASRQGTLTRILESISLFDPRPFGLPRVETLVMLGSQPDGKDIDPATTVSSAADYVGMLFSGLVRLAPDLSILPDLAETWAIDPGGTVYTFNLRKGIAFSSGDPITAQDVKDAWERVCDPEIKSTTARTYLGDIVGAKEVLDGKADHITGVEVVDDHTLRVTLDGPKPYFLAKLTYPVAFVYDARQAKGNPDSWMFTPRSTGPFTLRSRDGEEGLVFERNLAYWQPAQVQYLAFVENPGGSALSLYEEGTLDLLGIGGKDLKEVSRPSHAHHEELLTSPSLCTQMILLNPALPPLDDLQVRKALVLATDRSDLNDRLTEGTALLAHAVLPPAMPGTQAGDTLPAADPEAARQALAASKYSGETLQIRLIASGYADSQRQDVALLADQWQKALGVKVVVEYLDPENYTQAAKKQPAHAALYGWCADYPDPENFLDVLFHSESEFNISGLKDVEIDAWLEKARTEASPEERLSLYRQVQERLLQQGYVHPLLHNTSGILVNPRVSGYILSAGGAQVLHLVTLDP